MGTSINVRSPRTPQWKLANSILGSPMETDRQSLEMWRAARSDRGGNLLEELQSSSMFEAGSIAASESSVARAVDRFDDVLDDANETGFVFDLARRALMRSVNEETGADGFSAELFAETAGYYAARDLPSFIGSTGRISNVHESANLVDQLTDAARDVTRNTGPSPREYAAWPEFVRSIMDSLTGMVDLA